jgi:hypothetical protein
MRTCKACKTEKPLDEFYWLTNQHGQRYPEGKCKACRRAQAYERKEKRTADPVEAEKMRRWRREHKRKLRAGTWSREKVLRRKKALARKRQAIDLRNGQLDAHVRAWKRVLAQRRSLAKSRSTPKGKVDNRMGVAIYQALKAGKNGRSWEGLVGYTRDELMRHLEQQFKRGMSWRNMGDWHIDHILPRSMFCYSSPDDPDFKACWALSNLRPIWGRDNIQKNDQRLLLL